MIIAWNSTVSVPDDQVEEWALRIACLKVASVAVGTSAMLNALRVQILRGNIDWREVEIHYKGKVVFVNSRAAMSDWPEGLDDVNTRLLMELTT